ncbi:hypothetical protein [Pedobacter insulae]|uniref:Membrane or secreted protein n=1 Tax=Pedobacter insulae TaxID=414048 RepID=A0A1I2T7G7_9SPHI|nr:hypothetical protein [Pedobacter insulae]SFG58516.1 hypothetical protein SAMN04489864_101151 [Pedobacter insulae]
MKNFIAIYLSLFLLSANLQAQSTINGAWKLTSGENEHQLFIQDGFFFHTIHTANQFTMSRGGHISVKKDALLTKVLFNSADSSEVNRESAIPFSISQNMLFLNMPEGHVELQRVDDGKAPLAGVWHITGRMGDDGKIAEIHQTGTRQTYKLLTGTKFQWVAIDPAKKQFSGTGGGTYSFKDGKYTENIEFFSRDNTRVGASLAFDGKLENGKWHHSGLSSKGAKIYEIWSKVQVNQ